jgi:hypothetical protein
MKFCRGKKEPNQEVTGKSPGLWPQKPLEDARVEAGAQMDRADKFLNATEGRVACYGRRDRTGNRQNR